MITSTTDPDAFDEAVAWHQNRAPMTRAEWDALSLEQRRRAFTISQVAQARLVADVQESLERAIRDGVPLGEWQKTVKDSLLKAWAGSVENPPWRLELIYRNAVQTAYSAGRWQQIQHPETRTLRPYLQFDAILDGRTSPICAECNETIRPTDDPWWSGHVPPLHHACRSGVVTLDPEEARALGGVKPAPQIDASPGFGVPPGESSPLDMVNLDSFPEDLRAPLEQRLAPVQSLGPLPPPVPIEEPERPRPPTSAQNAAAKAASNKAKKIATAQEIDGIQNFTGGGYGRIRAIDRGGPPDALPMGRFLTAYQKHLDGIRSLMARAPRFQGTVYRGLYQLTDEALATLQTGSTIEIDAIASSSRDYAQAREFSDTWEDRSRAAVLVLKQRSGMAIETISTMADEREVLLPKGAKFRILRRYTIDDILHVEAEEE